MAISAYWASKNEQKLLGRGCRLNHPQVRERVSLSRCQTNIRLAELRDRHCVGAQAPKPQLAERDIEILRLLSQGASNQDIAEQLHIAEKTVRNRLTLIYRNLDLKNRTQAALYALHEGL